MKRREFIAALGGVAALPFAARAQQAMPVIGFLRSTSERGSAHLVKAFRAGLNDAGFVDGQNVAIEYRWAEDRLDRLPGMVADLVQRQVAVIVVNTLAAQVAVKATKTVPLVFASGSDPIRLGLVASLNRPGGNVTGVVFTVSDLMAKRLGLLRDLAPKAAVVAVLLDSNYPEIEIVAKDAETAGRAIGQQVLIVKAAGEDEFDAAFAAMVKAGAGALLVGGGPTFNNRRRQLVALAARHGLPASYVNREYADDGRPDDLRSKPNRWLPPCRHLRWPGCQGYEARRSAGCTGDQVRIGPQSEDRQGVRPDGAELDAVARRRGD
jgi:putative tryptophan/tyrosine transport system substrate-binding protein